MSTGRLGIEIDRATGAVSIFDPLRLAQESGRGWITQALDQEEPISVSLNLIDSQTPAPGPIAKLNPAAATITPSAFIPTGKTTGAAAVTGAAEGTTTLIADALGVNQATASIKTKDNIIIIASGVAIAPACDR